jgi:hypothetical protein
MLPEARLQLPPVLLAMIVFLSTGSFPVVVRRSPPPLFEELLLTVTLFRERVIPEAVVEALRIPPPDPLAEVTELSEIVTLVSDALCALFRPPPFSPLAKLPCIRVSFTERMPVLVALCIPPPSPPAMLFGPIVLS